MHDKLSVQFVFVKSYVSSLIVGSAATEDASVDPIVDVTLLVSSKLSLDSTSLFSRFCVF